MTVTDAIEMLGRELFGAQWTGEEVKARDGLVSLEEWAAWQQIKDLPINAPVPDGIPASVIGWKAPRNGQPWPFGNPEAEEYQREREANGRARQAIDVLIQRLEARQLIATVIDPWSGRDTDLGKVRWRVSDARRKLLKRQAPGDRAPQGTVYIRRPKLTAVVTNAPSASPGKTVSVDRLTAFLRGHADGVRTEIDCRQAALEHFGVDRLPEKSVWRPAWAQVPETQKRPRGNTARNTAK